MQNVEFNKSVSCHCHQASYNNKSRVAFHSFASSFFIGHQHNTTNNITSQRTAIYLTQHISFFMLGVPLRIIFFQSWKTLSVVLCCVVVCCVVLCCVVVCCVVLCCAGAPLNTTRQTIETLPSKCFADNLFSFTIATLCVTMLFERPHRPVSVSLVCSSPSSSSSPSPESQFKRGRRSSDYLRPTLVSEYVC